MYEQEDRNEVFRDANDCRIAPAERLPPAKNGKQTNHSKQPQEPDSQDQRHTPHNRVPRHGPHEQVKRYGRDQIG